MGPLERKTIALAVALAALPVGVAPPTCPSPVPNGALVLSALFFVYLAWRSAGSLARRMRELTEIANRLLDAVPAATQIAPGEDELGDLGRALTRITPRIADLVGRSTTELLRREAILASMNEGVLAVDARLNVTFCNNSFIQATGVHGPTEGVPLLRIVRDPALLRIVKRVVDAGEPRRERIQLSGGSETRAFEVYAAPLDSAPSRGAIAILHDVTPRERLERVKRDFIANVSHEIRTPLATIRGYAETLLDGGLEDEKNRRRFVEIIQATGVRLNNIAADLLTLSDLDAGRPAAPPGLISLADVIHGALRAIEPASNLNSVRVACGDIPDVHMVGYGIRLEQASLNLLDNAVKFNKPNGEVRVHLERRAADRIAIVISDTGIGIPPDDLSRVFERFYRADKARSRQVGGTGLGLSIVKHAIEQMNGTISAESELGAGTTFTVLLPLQSSAAPENPNDQLQRTSF